VTIQDNPICNIEIKKEVIIMSRAIIMRVTTIVFGLVFLCTCVWAAEWVDFEGKTPYEKQLQLRGILNKPKGDGPFPVVVMLCGCGGLKNENDAKQQEAWAKRLTSWGYVSLKVDSFGPRNYDNCGNGYVVDSVMRSYDAYSAKSYLSTLTFVDLKNIAVIGWSHGGWAVMQIITGLYRDKDSTLFQAAIAFYPWCDYISNLDTPLLILTGEKDDRCPARQCEYLQNSTAIKESPYEFTLKIYPNAHHCFDFEGLNEDVLGHHTEYNPEATADAIIQTREFLAKYLKVKK
jgi:dienelactone hydrolase